MSCLPVFNRIPHHALGRACVLYYSSLSLSSRQPSCSKTNNRSKSGFLLSTGHLWLSSCLFFLSSENSFVRLIKQTRDIVCMMCDFVTSKLIFLRTLPALPISLSLLISFPFSFLFFFPVAVYNKYNDFKEPFFSSRSKLTFEP